MSKEEFMVGKALETNTVTTGASFASVVNPEIWTGKIIQYAKEKNFLMQVAVEHNEYVGQGGSTFNITLNQALTAADLVETTGHVLSALNYTEITYTPAQVGVSVGITDKERVRAFFDILDERVKEFGYAFAVKKDAKGFAKLDAATLTQVTADGVAVASLTSSNQLETDEIAEADSRMRAAKREGKYFFVHPSCAFNLKKSADFVDASVYGGRETIMSGEVGKWLGIKIIETTGVPANSTNADAYNNYLLGDSAIGILWKQKTQVKFDYDVLKMVFYAAAHEDYDIQVEKTDAAVRVIAYKGF